MASICGVSPPEAPGVDAFAQPRLASRTIRERTFLGRRSDFAQRSASAVDSVYVSAQPSPPAAEILPVGATELVEDYAQVSGLGESDFGDALAVACVMSLWLETRGLAQRWDLLDGRRIGDEVRTQGRAQRMLTARHTGGMLLHLVQTGRLPAVRALTILRNLRFGLRTCDGSRRILDVQRQHLRDLILKRCGRPDPGKATATEPLHTPRSAQLH